jgi:predicted permease
MRTLRSWVVRLLSLFRRRQLEERLEEELGFHLEMEAREHEARGMSAEAARRAARAALAPSGPGWSVESLKEEMRARRGVPALETLGQDLRYALRMMRKSPGFTAVALLSLAFGIGTNTAIFSVVDALLLAPLPVPRAGELIVLQRHEDGIDKSYFSYSAYRQLADSAAVCTGVAAVTYDFRGVVRPQRPPSAPAGAGGGAGPDTLETAATELVSGNLFSVLGVGAAAGRTFTAAEDDAPGTHPVAVLGYGYWERRFGRDPGVVGQALEVNGATVTVVGVAPRGFNGAFVDGATDIYLPMTMRERVRYHSNQWTDGPQDPAQPIWNQVNVHWLRLLGRRRPEVGIGQAKALLGVIFERTKQAQLASHPDPETARMVAAQTLKLSPGARGMANWRQELTRPLLMLTGAAGLVLLIACANVANLLLARADGRRREMAVRLGIGAGQRRLVRQLLTESLLLASMGGALGVLFGAWGSRLLLTLVSLESVPLQLDVALDPRKLAFAVAVAMATGVGFGLAPALQATRIDLASALKEGARAALGGGAGRARGPRSAAGDGGGRGAGRGWRGRRLPLGRALVAAQIALSLLLLIGAGLFVRSLQNLVRLDPGFDREGLVLAEINPRLLGYDDARLVAAYDRVVERLEAIPGVRSASLSLHRLLTFSRSTGDIYLPGAAPSPGHALSSQLTVVTPHYFATAGMPLVRGRTFEPRDRQGAPKVVIVNQALVRKFFPHRSGIGEHLGSEPGSKASEYEVVGVVRDARYNELGETTPPMIYLPVAQNPESLRDVELRVAGTAAATAVEGGLRRAIAEAEPRLAVLDTLTMSEQVDRSLARERTIARLTGFFGALALLLAAIGLYGVMSYSVARRTGEIGLRMALGAARGRVLAMVLGDTLRLIAIGVATGLAAALATTRLAASQIYGLTAFDPPTVAVATLVLVAVALLAGFLPARRAADTSPMAALRYE